MSQRKSATALQSLTATYTDSENEDGDIKEETLMDIDEISISPELVPETVTPTEEMDDDLPPEPNGRCLPELEMKIKSLFDKADTGVDLNKMLQNKKAFRNPSIYEKLIEFCNINELGTNYPVHIYDPFRWGKESYYDELAKVQATEMEKREKEKKEKTKVEIVSGTAKKVNIVNDTHVTSTNTTSRKSKWDQKEAR